MAQTKCGKTREVKVSVSKVKFNVYVGIWVIRDGCDGGGGEREEGVTGRGG